MKVLYATDGFPAAIAAGDLVRELCSREAVEVTVVTVTHSGSLDPDHVMLELDPIEARRQQSEEIVSATVQAFVDAGFRASPLILEGKPGPELVKAAGDGGFELVVVGEGGPPSIGRRLLGSVSTHVLRHSTRPVLIVPPPAG